MTSFCRKAFIRNWDLKKKKFFNDFCLWWCFHIFCCSWCSKLTSLTERHFLIILYFYKSNFSTFLSENKLLLNNFTKNQRVTKHTCTSVGGGGVSLILCWGRQKIKKMEMFYLFCYMTPLLKLFNPSFWTPFPFWWGCETDELDVPNSDVGDLRYLEIK